MVIRKRIIDSADTYRWIMWLNENTKGAVSVSQYHIDCVYIGFEEEDDALMFRIKYGE